MRIRTIARFSAAAAVVLWLPCSGGAVRAQWEEVEIVTLPLGLSDFDAAGCRSGWVEFPGQPVEVWGGDESLVYRARWRVIVPAGQVTKVWTFLGTDAGDHFEADFEIVSQEGIRLYQRSPHHHQARDYDAWQGEDVSYTCGHARGCALEVIHLGRVTDENSSSQNLESYGLLRARFHSGLRLQICSGDFLRKTLSCAGEMPEELAEPIDRRSSPFERRTR